MSRYIITNYNGDFDVWDNNVLILEDVDAITLAEFLDEN